MFVLADVRDLAGRIGIDIIGPVGTVQKALSPATDLTRLKK